MGSAEPTDNGNADFHNVPIKSHNGLDSNLSNNNNVFPAKIKQDESAHPPGAKTFQSALPQILATSAKNMLLFAYGTTLGLPTIAIPALKAMDEAKRDPYLQLTRTQISWFSSISLICVPLGCLASGALTQPFGRKRSMMYMNIPYGIAFVLFAMSRDVSSLYIALLMCGLTGGLMEAPVLTYVAEITQPHLRGMLSAIASMAVMSGQVSQLMLGSFLPWRTVALINIVWPVLSAIILYFIPESPHWLIDKGRIKDAETSLCWLRGWTTPENVQVELSQITKSIENSKMKRIGKDGVKKAHYKMYLRRTFLLPFFIVTVTFFVGQMGGIVPLITYAVNIFESLHAPINPYIATVFLGISHLSGAFLCVILIHYTGKRPLVLVSTIGAGLCLMVVAVYAQFQVSLGWDTPLVPLIFLLGFGFLSHLCIRMIPWMLIGEVYPNNIRSTASGLSASSAYIFGFSANKLFYPMRDIFELHGLFYFYACVNLLGAGILYTFMPETESRCLSDIETHFADKTKTFDTHVVRTDKPKKGVDNPALDTVEKY